MFKPNVLMSSPDFDVKGPFSENSIFFGEIELFHLRGFVKDWCQADEDPKMRLL
jgi:hypothetical protein